MQTWLGVEEGLDNIIIPPVFINTIIKDSMAIDLKDNK